MNDKLKELDKKKILNISNESAIKEKIKKIEVSKHFKEIKIKEEYLDFLLRDMFLRLDLESLDEFEVYLKNYDLTLETVKKKITINALWNELIMKKYTSQVAINEEQIRKKISKIDNIQSKEYLLSEIIFEIENKKDLQKKYNEIVKSIAEIGFENSASTYSISETANTGGEIGWISENSLNNKIKENINHLQIGEISKPIILSNGILILKIVNNKTSKIKIDLQTEFKKALDYERNRQLSQYSTIYYNKVKKNLEFDG